jgi:hypothetical protein
VTRRKGEEGLAIAEAVEHLSSMADLDVSATEGGGKSRWLDPALFDDNRKLVKHVFRSVLGYLRRIYEQDRKHLKDFDMQRGVQAIMVLAGEAVQKVDKITSVYKGKYAVESVTQLKEYQDLQQFYLDKLTQRFTRNLALEEMWQAEMQIQPGAGFDAERQVLRDLEAVKKDRDYELFYIRKEDGSPFFGAELLRHMRLVGSIEALLADAERADPFARATAIQERGLHVGAQEILRHAAQYVEEFYKGAMRVKERPLVAALNKALMALMLAANGRNLIENTTGKSVWRYFADFHDFLREALQSDEYLRLIERPPGDLEHFSHTLVQLCHALCCHLMTRAHARAEAVAFIQRLAGEGAETGKIPLWNALADGDERMRRALSHLPSAPIMWAFRGFSEDAFRGPFDPLRQGGCPSLLFTLSYRDNHVSCLHLPSPVKQGQIHVAACAEEFYGFVRFLRSRMKVQRHLLINLQDRTSWKEHARSVLLEQAQEQAACAGSLIVLTLPKHTEFYLQSGAYADLSDSRLFLAQFLEQIEGGGPCGFFLPAALRAQGMNGFVEPLLQQIHLAFFEGKRLLTRQNRLDFVEIFYQFFVLKAVDLLAPDSLSFTCKDGVDTGAAASAHFFSAMRLMKSHAAWTVKETEFLLWMLHAPALLVRNRPIDALCLSRFLSAAAWMQRALGARRKEILALLAPLFSPDLFASFNVQESREL